jgi:hypothetical protein
MSHEQIQVCSWLIAQGSLVLSSSFKCDASLMLRLPPKHHISNAFHHETSSGILCL